jgi:hypothetical protein
MVASNRPCSGVGCRLARLVDLRDHRRRGVVAPAHGTQELLQVGGAELDPGLVEGIAHLAAERVVVGEDAVAERLLQLRGGVDQAPVTLPGLGVEELLLLLLGQPLLRGLFVALVFVVSVVRAPFGEPSSRAAAATPAKSSKSASPNSS